MLSGVELLLPDAPAWRDWLGEHGETETAVWLVLSRKSGTATALDYAAALDEALCFGWIDGQKRSRDAHTTFQRWTPRGPRSRWSRINVGHVERLTAAGRMRMPGLTAVAAAQADGRWEAAYAGSASLEMPADLVAAIGAVPEAQAMYDMLTAQNRYALYFRLADVRTAAARERRIRSFVEQLARGETPYPQRRRPEVS